MGVTGCPSGTITNLSTALGATLTWVASNAVAAPAGVTWDAGNFSPASNGLLVIQVMGQVTGDVNGWTSVSVGGSAATIWYANPTGGFRHAIATIPVTAGTYDITVTHDGSSTSGVAVGVWLLTGYQRTSPTCINWEDAASTTEPIVYDRTVGGVFIGAALINITTALTWSSATKRLDVTEGTCRYTFADISTPFTVTSQATETVTWTGTSITSTHLGVVFV